MKKCYYDKETVNEAIAKVISNKYKKDCPEAHMVVENAGYTIYKRDGSYTVKNSNTNKVVYIRSLGDYGWERLVYGKVDKRLGYNRDFILKKFDYVNCLDTPINDYDPYYDPYLNSWRYVSKAKENYKTLRSYRYDINFHNRELEDAKKKFEKAVKEYQQSVDWHNKRIVEATNNLDTLKKKLGLVKEA